MTLWAMANMLGIPLGPIVGGWLLEHYRWGSVFLLNIPFTLIAIAAVAWLMPESRSERRTRIDVPGILSSSAGLVGVTFGVIRSGEHGWSDSFALPSIAAGILLLAGFALWQKRTPHPLIELSLFRSRSFTWGSLLATLVTFALFGLLFGLPLFYQAVNGYDSFGTGLRLLPLIGGLIVGAKLSERLLASAGAKVVSATGFAVMATGLILGTTTGADSGYAFISIWITISGIGLGFALPTAMASALNRLNAERSGVGSALIMAMRQVGGAIGVAILGAAINAFYRRSLELTEVPKETADTVRQSVTAGVEAARGLDSARLLADVQQAFVHGMSAMLWICGGIAALGIVLSLLFLPREAARSSTETGI